MDGSRFDTLTRTVSALSERSSRRGGLRLLAAGALLAGLDHLQTLEAEAKKKKGKKKKKKKQDERECPHSCTSDADCCDAACCKLPNALDGYCCSISDPYCHHFKEGTVAACLNYPQSI